MSSSLFGQNRFLNAGWIDEKDRDLDTGLLRSRQQKIEVEPTVLKTLATFFLSIPENVVMNTITMQFWVSVQ